MKKLSAFILTSICVSCSSTDLPDTPAPEPAPEVQKVSEYHEKIRTRPYPLAESTIFVNPAPLIVPQKMKSGATIQFQLSADSTFQSASTITSKWQKWCMFNPHRRLEEGKWFWRFRSDNSDWSEPMSFTVTGEEDRYVTPSFEIFANNSPRRHPRINCFIDAGTDIFRQNAPSHPEYRMLLARANDALSLSLDNADALYSEYGSLMNSVMWLSDAYIITVDEKYAAKLLLILKTMTANPPSDGQLFTENFATSAITYAYTAIYDLLCHRLSPQLKAAAEEQMMRALERFTEQNIGYQENHIFDNHFWQQNMRVMFQTAFALFDNPALSARVMPILEYYYELWCSRAPATGFSRDGLWHNGVGYMSANIQTLAYMPKLLSYVTRFDFLSHPWYRAAGKGLCYSCPTGSMGVGFGDQSERYLSTNRLYPAFADFLAAETGDSFAGWYAGRNMSLLQTDYELRLHRMTRIGGGYSYELPDDVPGMSIYPDAGEVTMHTDISDTSRDLALAFRSSGFGSGSHTTASQNAFNLYYGGRPVFHSSGYYQNFSDAHNLMSYRHSRAHNTILVNGIGQPYTTRAYGSMTRAAGGATICYALGDASNAYCGITDDQMWVDAFAKAGITQTPQNGFGNTPLTRYRRHVAMLQDGIVVIYDELEASETARWDWLLHSDTKFDISGATIRVNSGNALTEVTLLSKEAPALSQTSDFVVPPAIRGERYPDQWHLSARIDGTDKTRILAVIQTKSADDDLKQTKQLPDGVTIGNWTITAELDASKPAAMKIVNSRTSTGLSFGNDDFMIEKTEYRRAYAGSTIIVDKENKTLRATELTDITPANSRAAR